MKVFISHSSKDNRFIRTLKEDLRENNIETWVDLDSIRPGDRLSEKLDVALDEMTHFLIVLTPNSVESDWVNKELENAISKKTEAFKKIIPLRYRKCDIPKSLKKFVWADLSEEVVIIDGDRIKFIGDKYHKTLQLIVEAIEKDDYSLTENDKTKIKKNIENEFSETLQQKGVAFTSTRARYQLVGYSTKSSQKEILQKKIASEYGIEENSAFPVLLPALLSSVFKDIKIGERIEFTYKGSKKAEGHFAGFRKDDLKIVIPIEIRRSIQIKNLNTYIAEIDIQNRRINFLDG